MIFFQLLHYFCYTINGLLLFLVWRKICNMGYLYNLWNHNMFIRIAWYAFKIQTMMKVDLSKQINENIYHINRYNICVRREKLFANFVLDPVFVFLAICMFIEMKARFDLWVFLICMVALASLTTYWTYKNGFTIRT